MRQIWAIVLGVKEDDIGLDDDFFQSDGDSLGVMRLVVEARRRKVAISAANIFKYPHLGSIAALVSDVKPLHKQSIKQAFSAITQDALRDVLPCTAMQKEFFYADGLIPSTHRWHSILRTVFIPYEGKILQVFIRPGHIVERFSVQEISLEDSIQAATERIITVDKADAKMIGRPMPRFVSLCETGETGITKPRFLILRFSHMQSDGYSMPFAIGDLAKLYAEAIDSRVTTTELPPSPQFSFSGSRMTHLVDREGSTERVYSLTDTVSKHIDPDLWRAIIGRTTFSADGVLTAAWAIALTIVLSDSDIVFERTVLGRGVLSIAGELGTEYILDPCANKVPVRIRLPTTENSDGPLTGFFTLWDTVAQVHEQNAQTLRLERYGS
ncbi:hypothetical protein GQ44DRAFT_822206 [Phaeosphaeriaceae sp. PMI808]|nr:hypothetical protein GQ44DRAFT_822206 [Phaeosphaeriaceae sp. PMI808]